mmetsp:Transcript_24229/g.49033  ORF Transcript_24229/g.49033 Transcript_24229/m.49033 type:complete len:207 (-) Transcript_24229:852-1472(-)
MSPSKKRKHACALAASCGVEPVAPCGQPVEQSSTRPTSCPCIDMCNASSTFDLSSNVLPLRTCSTRRSVSASASEHATQKRPLCSGRSRPLVSILRNPLALTPPFSPNSAISSSSSSSGALQSVAASTTSPRPSFVRRFPSVVWWWCASSVCTFASAASCLSLSLETLLCSSGVSSRRESASALGAHSQITITFLIRRSPPHAGLK